MKNNPVKVVELTTLITRELATVSDSPRLDAELLVAAVLQKNRAWLLTYPEQLLTTEQQNQLADFVIRRARGEPIAYILGYKEFWGLKFKVNADVLIPRPETEHVVEWILQQFGDSPLRVADLGAGSGAIATALAVERPQWQIDATDNSPDSLTIAQQNAESHHVSNVHFHLGDWTAALPCRQYDLIVSNPPYIAEQDPHLSVLNFEPQSALCSGMDGLDAIRTIVNTAADFLAPAGYLILEHGYDQAPAVTKLLQQQKFIRIQTHHDLSHHPRFVTAMKPESL